MGADGLRWRAKLVAKVVAGVVPVSYARLRSLGVGRHGHMESPSYARDVVAQHLAACGVDGGGFTGLELGPGDSLASALVARALGADETTLVDVGPFANDDVRLYRHLASELASQGLAVPDLSGATTVGDVCRRCHARYLTEGLTSLRSLPDSSFDAVWSHAVLEHVAADELEAVLAEMFRLLRPGARASHRIDLRDHLAEGLNNLRFSERIWESRLVRRSGAYTNRLRPRRYLDVAERLGYEVVRCDVERWDSLPFARRHLAEPFASLPDEELLVCAFDLVLQRPVQPVIAD